MKNKIRISYPLLIFVVTFYSCTKNDFNVFKNDNFEYSYNCFFDTSFSFTITDRDTITIKQEYHGNNLDFKCELTKEDKYQINNWLNDIDFTKLNMPNLSHDVLDGESYNFNIHCRDFSKSITVCDNNGPIELKQLSENMLKFKRKLQSKATKKNTVGNSGFAK